MKRRSSTCSVNLIKSYECTRYNLNKTILIIYFSLQLANISAIQFSKIRIHQIQHFKMQINHKEYYLCGQYVSPMEQSQLGGTYAHTRNTPAQQYEKMRQIRYRCKKCINMVSVKQQHSNGLFAKQDQSLHIIHYFNL